MIQIDQDTILAALGGGGIGWYLISKLRRALKHDEGDMAAYTAMKETIESLHIENTHLRKSVSDLQQEVAKLHMVIAELTSKITTYALTSENQKALDELAKEGRIERRKDRLKEKEHDN